MSILRYALWLPVIAIACVFIRSMTADTVQAHYGKVPCEIRDSFVKELRRFSQGNVHIDVDLSAVLDMVVEAYTHCQQEGLRKRMEEWREHDHKKISDTNENGDVENQAPCQAERWLKEKMRTFSLLEDFSSPEDTAVIAELVGKAHRECKKAMGQ